MNAATAFANLEEQLLAQLESAQNMDQAISACMLALEQTACELAQDEQDELARRQAQEMFPDRKIVGVMSREVAFGGGNIHCITQQQPAARQ